MSMEAIRRVRFDPVLGQEIADAYTRAPRRDDGALAAYRGFLRETVRQYQCLIGRVEFGGLGVSVRVVDEDPYPDMAAIVADVRRRRLRVFSTAACGNPHPF